eukprot:7321676-Pyramimonas_sp.AAC.1
MAARSATSTTSACIALVLGCTSLVLASLVGKGVSHAVPLGPPVATGQQQVAPSPSAWTTPR